jgi:hypothetical protein
MAKKAYERKPSTFPTRQCPGCGKYYHARSKQCPECNTPNPTATGVSRKTKRVKVKRKKAIRRGAPRRHSPGDVLHQAIEFIEAAGGLENAKAALDTIERVRRL